SAPRRREPLKPGSAAGVPRDCAISTAAQSHFRDDRAAVRRGRPPIAREPAAPDRARVGCRVDLAPPPLSATGEGPQAGRESSRGRGRPELRGGLGEQTHAVWATEKRGGMDVAAE